MNGTSSARSALAGRLLLGSFLLGSAFFGLGAPAGADTTDDPVDIQPFTLAPGASVTIEFEVTIENPLVVPTANDVRNQGSVSGNNFGTVNTDDPDTGSVGDPTITLIQKIADIAVTKTDGAVNEVPGTPVTYTIVVSSAGPDLVVDGVLADTFPASLSGCSTTSVAAGGASGNDIGPFAGNINDTGLNLPTGGSITYTSTCNISPSATGSLANTATVSSASTTDPVPGNNSATDTDTLVPSTDLSITKTDGSTTEVPGTPVTYTIVASNAGPSTATGVGVTDTFPASLAGCSVSSVAAGGATGNDVGPVAGNLNDTGITLPPSASVTYTATCNISASATGTLSNTANIASGTADPDPANNSATDNDTLTPQADLAITKTDGQASDVPGSTLTYTVVVSNSTGPSVEPNATFNDTIPASLTSCSTTSTAAGGATGNDAGPVPGNALADTGLNLPVGSSVTYTIACTIDPAATATVTNTASVAATVTDPVPGNNSATDNTTLTPQADLSITKTDGSATEVPGTPVTYTVVASNAAGPSTVPATVSDTFSGLLTGCAWTTVAAGGATGNDNSSGGVLSDGITLPTGSSVTYTITCDIDPAATGSLVNTATIAAGAGVDSNPGNNSATDSDTLVPSADVAISKTNNQTSVVPGGSTTYEIVASNNGPSTATSVTVADTFPAALTGCTWTSVATGGATGNDAGPTAGNINDGGITLPPGAGSHYVTYTATCTVDPSATGNVVNTATITTATTDPVAGNNSATDTDPITPLDLGDAPTAAQSGFASSYPVTLAQDGARHVHLGLMLGASRDVETDGQPNATATGDDLNDTDPGSATDDEDGVTVPSSLVACQGATFNLTFSAASGFVNAWIDYNRDGDWADAGEQVATNVAITGTAQDLAITVPCGITLGGSVARFRVSSASGLAPTGLAADGEVEDHAVTLVGLDYGDAPNSSLGAFAYPVLNAEDGARHVPTGPTLGALRDGETNGQPSVNALLDDTTGTDDEDGVVFPALVRATNATVVVTASAPGSLQAWFDWNADGDWSDSGEQAVTNLALAAGPNNVSVAVPAGVTPDGFSYARFRFATATGVLQTGQAADGEVEDYRIQFASIANKSITKTDGAASEIPGTTVTYTIVASNAGPSTDSNVTVADTFPASLSGCSTTSVAAGGATGHDAGPFAGNINDTGITLPMGGSVTYTSTCTIDSAATGSLANTATVTGAAFDENGADNSATDTDTLTPQADLSITKTDGAASEIPGTAVTYTIVASNAGPSTDPNVTVADTFPASLTGCSTTSTTSGTVTGNDAGPFAGNINDTGISMGPSSSVTYTVNCTIAPTATGTLVNTATVAASVADPDPANNSATDSDTLAPETDLSISKTDGQTTDVPGTTVTYTILVSASGPSTDSNVTIADTFPAVLTGCSTTSVAAGGATGNDAGPFAGNINDTGISMPTASSVTYTSTCTIAPTATGILTNTATAAASIPDPSPANNSATDNTTLAPEADLSITKTDGQTSEVPGTTVVYTITASNPGPSHEPNATIGDDFPASLTGCSWTATPFGGASGQDAGSGDPLNDAGVVMPPGGGVTYTVTCTVDPSATGNLVNTATVAASVTDPSPGNNSATDSDTLTPQADLSIDKQASPTAVGVGQAVTYTITVTNAGPSVATNVVVSDALPAGITFGSTTGCAEDPNGVPTCTLGTIGVGASDAFTIAVTVSSAGQHVNTASVSSAATDPNPGNNSDDATVSTDVIPPQVLGLDHYSSSAEGDLAACATVLEPVYGVEVQFNEPMSWSEGGAPGPDDADNVDNYMLVGPGANLDFETTSCAGLGGDDVEIAGSSVTYLADEPVAGQALARVAFNAGHPLAPGLYRFFACGSTTLVDIVGNELDGDGDGAGGDDHVLTFRVDTGNNLANGHFDCSLNAWTLTPPASPAIEHDETVDSQSSADSGSALFDTTGQTALGLHQCVRNQAYLGFGQAPYTLSGAVMLDELTASQQAGVLLGCTYYASTDCSGASLGVQTDSVVHGDTAGLWLARQLSIVPPAGTQSMSCGVSVSNPANPNPDQLDLWSDRLRLIGTPNIGIFSDGFESGNTAGWSATSP